MKKVETHLFEIQPEDLFQLKRHKKNVQVLMMSTASFGIPKYKISSLNKVKAEDLAECHLHFFLFDNPFPDEK